MLILLRGKTGTGKSTFADALGARYRDAHPDHRVVDFSDPRLLSEERHAIEGETAIDTAEPIDACVALALSRCAERQPA